MATNDQVVFDPTIFELFARDADTWPAAQARLGLRIIRAVVAGDFAEIDVLLNKQTGAYRDLTVEQFRRVTDTLSRIFGEWTH
jgi:hypothetical protein